MSQRTCRRRALSLGRRLISDGLAFSCGDHAATGERTMRLADVIAARRAAVPRPSWCAVMLKAFAIAAARHPEMRQVFLRIPWGHLCEFNTQIASIAINRQISGENTILLAQISSPEHQSLEQIDGHLRRYQEGPLEDVSAFRSALRIARLPAFVRRTLFWLALNLFPRQRAKRFGTFMVTTMSPYGAKVASIPTLGHPILHYGAFTEAGDVPVGLTVDHRVMDGSVVGFTLLEMEQVLHHDIVAEMRRMTKTLAA